jgi:cytochrome c oxidase subunit IV
MRPRLCSHIFPQKWSPFKLYIQIYQDNFPVTSITLPFCLKRDSFMILSSILNFSMTTNFTIFCGQGRVTWDHLSLSFCTSLLILPPSISTVFVQLQI